MLSWGFATGEGVCAGGLMLRKRITNRAKGAEKPKRFQKGPLSCRRENQLWTSPLLDPRRGVSVKPLQATARRRAAVCGA